MKSNHSRFQHIQNKIKITQKPVTILFTDIEDSGRFWDTRGDKMGRLMVDTHNRLIFPIIKKFRGKVVKTIGDALMVSFRKSISALKAAIAIQQILNEERKKNPGFPKVRIGIHSGKAVVERSDVFGDMVNVASRIEARARGNEILLSAQAVRNIPKNKFKLDKEERFKPKGKQMEITLYKCQWRKAPRFIDHIKFKSQIIIKPLQKLKMIGSALAGLSILVFLYLRYIRYLFIDSEWLALILLNPKRMLLGHPFILILFIVLILLGAILFLRMKIIPIRRFQIIQGDWVFASDSFRYIFQRLSLI